MRKGREGTTNVRGTKEASVCGVIPWYGCVRMWQEGQSVVGK